MKARWVVVVVIILGLCVACKASAQQVYHQFLPVVSSARFHAPPIFYDTFDYHAAGWGCSGSCDHWDCRMFTFLDNHGPALVLEAEGYHWCNMKAHKIIMQSAPIHPTYHEVDFYNFDDDFRRFYVETPVRENNKWYHYRAYYQHDDGTLRYWPPGQSMMIIDVGIQPKKWHTIGLLVDHPNRRVLRVCFNGACYDVPSNYYPGESSAGDDVTYVIEKIINRYHNGRTNVAIDNVTVWYYSP